MSPTIDAAHHRRGLLITGLGGLALSFDIPLIRSSEGEIWSLLAVRSLCTFVVALVAWVVLNRFLGRKIATANVVFIVAFTSMFAAVLSWIFLKERPSNATLVTMAIMIFGVGLIVQDGLKSGNFFGDAMAVCSALLLASAITVSRASGRDMGLVPLATAIFPCILGYLLSPAEGLAIVHPGWIIFDGLVMIPLAFFCLATGPRYLSAPEVGMFYLLETILAPIWIGIVFSEVPTIQTLAGGAVLILALVGHSIWQMRRKSACDKDAATEFPLTG